MDDSDDSAADFASADHAAGIKKRLAETQRQLRLLEELAHIGFWRVDVVTDVLHWSDEVFAIHGLSRETFRPTVASAIERYHPDDREFVRKSVAQAVEQKRPFDFELRLIRTDGQVRQVIARGRPELDDDGQVFSVVGIFQDVTDQRRADIERRRSLERLRVHMEHTPLGVIEWDRDFRVVEWNARCEEIFGYSREEALGQNGADLLVPEEWRPHVREIFDDLLAGDGGSHSVNQNVTKEGRLITCDWHNTPLVGEDGEPNGVASICQDITERQSLQAQVTQLQKMDAIGTLAGGIAHDINNVLAVVMGLGSLLSDSFADTDARKADAREILAAAERGRAMVQNLLDFARQEPSRLARWPPAVAIRRLADLLTKTVPKGISVHTDVARDVADVMAEGDQLSTALMNLCVNASQAIGEHGSITVRARNVEVGPGGLAGFAQLEPGPYVCIQVIDDGAGMDEATLARACEPFFTTKDVGEGTGLGLAMAHGTVERHRGRLSLESVRGEGTTISIYLPAANAPHDEVSAPAHEQAAKHGTVLVVDDEAMVLRTTRRVLETLGYRVYCGEGALAGLEAFQTHAAELDVVLLDLSMPKMNGLECLAQIRARNTEVPVIICTGHGRPNQTERLLAAGAAAVLQKPFDRAALAATLERVQAKG